MHATLLPTDFAQPLLTDSRAWFSSSAHDALAVMLALAAEPERISGSILAAHTLIPTSRLDRVVRILINAELIIGYRGRTGGYALRRSPQSVTLLEILDAAMPHATAPGDAVFGGLSAALRAWMRVTTLDMLVAKPSAARV